MKHTKKISLFLLTNISLFLYTTPLQLSFTLPFTITGKADKTTFFLQDAAHKEFVLKYHPRGPRRAIHDTLGAQIGKSIGLNINEVEIFSPDDQFNQLFNDIKPISPAHTGITTLHSRVPGKQIKDIKYMNDDIYIKHGLCKEKHLNSIIHYKQLCDIVAFDLFIDNTDRNNRNFFFDETTDEFYAIDMDHGFKSAYALVMTSNEYDFDTLATRAYDFIKKFKKRPLYSQEIKALKRVKHTLEILVHRNSPETIFTQWMEIADKADYVYTSREQEKIKKYLEYHLIQINRLVALLNDIMST